jgi:hypothetical protein
MMKKEIIYKLEQEEILVGLSIMKELTNKLSDYEKKKIKMMILLLECKIKIEKGLKISH